MQEIAVDNFAGGGGASVGMELAFGRSVDIAINHDPAAIAMHLANHPETEHYCESVWDVDPREVTRGRPVGLCWLSPDCKHFSKAKGGKPKEKGIRGLAWVALRWAATVRPRVIMLENVEEFKTWGPLLKDGMPDPKNKGREFNAFINALKRQGYQVDHRELRACDYGAPTIRKRFFLIARCDGRPIVWPEPTHGDPESAEVKSGKLLPWRTAAEIIDWSLPCPSIFERKKPLAENTLRRIARGIQRFVIDNPNPFIVKVNHQGEQFRGQQISEPMQTITAKNGWGIVTPYIARIGQTGFGGDRLQYEVEEPLTTIITKAEHLLVTPVLGVNTSGHPGSSVDEPLRTVTTGGHHMLISPALIQMGYGEREGQQPRVLDLEKPIGTVTAGGNKFGLATAELIAVPHITKFRTGATGHDVNEPLHTVTSGAGSKRPAGAAHAMGMVTAFLSRQFGQSVGHAADAPAATITAGGGGKSALVTSHLVKMRGTNTGQRVDVPLQTVTAGGNHFGEVRAFLMAYYGSSVGQKTDEPLGTVTTRDRFGLVTIHGQDYQIVDIGMRMLEPHELFAAQGFPDTYIIDRDADGKSYPKSAQVARCGNSVPPPFAEALVRANLPEMCTGSGNSLAFERYKQQEGQLQLSM
ncbi:DNA cytosine methyltransferase [Brevibacillus brevis]|uniref:DNA cytosine methyltransferase n=4 Tax=Brevibacillus brevis TaxID=1393 RepID=UPI000F6D169B|nr:DNA cytosine methyltransferase [Brevibacillus brevis]VEF87604.1 DNA (cytosine-5-)-methyltransferase [Brevibacillus brevis]VEF90164.1 DNA (cytosine-5-)-methyltransferase [Brevibacillus brevis]